MKILFFEWGSYLYYDIVDSLRRMGANVRVVSYFFNDMNHDDYFVNKFSAILEDKYDAVISVNFWPLVSLCCYKAGIKYISWVSDCPVKVDFGDASLANPTNYIFYFDYNQFLEHQAKGYENGYHLPLAVNTARLEGLKTGPEQHKRFDTDISFVGNLYNSSFDSLLRAMEPYRHGYFDGIIRAQYQLYGAYIIDKLINDTITNEIVQYFKDNKIGITGGQITTGLLRNETAKTVTKLERLTLLEMLSRWYGVKLYSESSDELLKNVTFMGTADYLENMNHVFRCSKINLNISLKCITSGIPQRALDIMGAGGFLLSNFQPELAEYFEHGKDMVMYESIEHAVDLCDYYMNHEDERLTIARQGMNKIKEHFSYEIQLKKIFEIAGLNCSF